MNIIIFSRPATFKHMPLIFLLIGTSFWALKSLNKLIEGSTMKRIVGNPLTTQGTKERNDKAMCVYYCIKHLNCHVYLIRLFLMHFFSLFLTFVVANYMLHFVELELDFNLFTDIQKKFEVAYFVPFMNRTQNEDIMIDLFPRFTIHETGYMGASGTWRNVDIFCVQPTASLLELSYLSLLYLVGVALSIMIVEKLFCIVYVLYQCLIPRYSALSFDKRVVLYLVTKNVDPLVAKYLKCNSKDEQ